MVMLSNTVSSHLTVLFGCVLLHVSYAGESRLLDDDLLCTASHQSTRCDMRSHEIKAIASLGDNFSAQVRVSLQFQIVSGFEV